MLGLNGCEDRDAHQDTYTSLHQDPPSLAPACGAVPACHHARTARCGGGRRTSDEEVEGGGVATGAAVCVVGSGSMGAGRGCAGRPCRGLPPVMCPARTTVELSKQEAEFCVFIRFSAPTRTPPNTEGTPISGEQNTRILGARTEIRTPKEFSNRDNRDPARDHDHDGVDGIAAVTRPRLLDAAIEDLAAPL